MLPFLSGATQQYLSDLQRINSEMADVSRQLSSGLRVTSVSDDPAAVEPILLNQSRISQLTQTQTNLNNLKPELETGDTALSEAMKQVESAISIASQSTSPLSNADSMAQLTIQVQGILQNLVNLSASTSGGRYIFSGDLDQQALYTIDPTQPTGVRQLAATKSTRGITDANGVQIWLGKTASEIFDARDASNNPASDNVFAAVNSLLTALQANNSAAAEASITNLKLADSHLNQEQGYYGIGQARVNDTLTAISSSLVSVRTDQSSLRDADMATAAVELQQLTVQQQAALSSRAKIGGTNLFDFLA
ncbi:MAG TPA: flagellin [Bryobacteraceae bacterium]|nr:flagellin [Bryobacteraceae bacterium]